MALPPEQDFVTQMRRASSRVTVTDKVLLKPESQTWVTVRSARTGLVIIEPYKRLFEKHNCLAATGVHQVEADKPFRILVENFTKYPCIVQSGRNVAHVDEHLTNLAES